MRSDGSLWRSWAPRSGLCAGRWRRGGRPDFAGGRHESHDISYTSLKTRAVVMWVPSLGSLWNEPVTRTPCRWLLGVRPGVRLLAARSRSSAGATSDRRYYGRNQAQTLKRALVPLLE